MKKLPKEACLTEAIPSVGELETNTKRALAKIQLPQGSQYKVGTFNQEYEGSQLKRRVYVEFRVSPDHYDTLKSEIQAKLQEIGVGMDYNDGVAGPGYVSENWLLSESLTQQLSNRVGKLSREQ